MFCFVLFFIVVMCIFPVAIIFTIFPCWYRRHTVDLLFHGVKLTLFPYIYLSSCPACSRFGAYSPKQTHKKDWTKHKSSSWLWPHSVFLGACTDTKSFCVSSSFHKGINPTIRSLLSWFNLTLITSQRGLEFQHILLKRTQTFNP